MTTNVAPNTIPSWTPEPEARRIMFEASATCRRCHKPIASIDECQAVLFVGLQVWKLLHNEKCAADAILAAPPFGMSPKKYLRTFGR